MSGDAIKIGPLRRCICGHPFHAAGRCGSGGCPCDDYMPVPSSQDAAEARAASTPGVSTSPRGGCDEQPHEPGRCKFCRQIACDAAPAPAADPVTAPAHYRWIPGHECRELAAYLPFNLGSALKYIYRSSAPSSARKPGADPIEDLRKAVECIRHEIRRLGGAA